MNAMKEIEKVLATVSKTENLVGTVEWNNMNSTFASMKINSKYGHLEILLVVEVLEAFENKKCKYTIEKMQKNNNEDGYYGEMEYFTKKSTAVNIEKALLVGARSGMLKAKRNQ